MTCKHPKSSFCVECKPELWSPEDAAGDAIGWMAEKLKKAKIAYYKGKPILSDNEFDALENSLKAYAPEHPILQKVGFDKSGNVKDTKILVIAGTYKQAQNYVGAKEIKNWAYIHNLNLLKGYDNVEVHLVGTFYEKSSFCALMEELAFMEKTRNIKVLEVKND